MIRMLQQEIKGFSRLIPSNFVSLWDFDDGVNRLNDKIGSNDLTLSGVASGNPLWLIGRGWDFTGGQVLEANNDMSLSFTDGVNDVEGGFSMLIRFNSIGAIQIIINRRNNFGEWYLLNREYQLYHDGTYINFRIFDQINGGYIQVLYSWTPTLLQDYHIQCYYDGSGLHTGLKMYVDGIPVGTTEIVGTYVNNQNYNTKLVIGAASWSRNAPFDGRLDEIKKSKIVLTDDEALELATKELAGIKVI